MQTYFPRAAHFIPRSNLYAELTVVCCVGVVCACMFWLCWACGVCRGVNEKRVGGFHPPPRLLQATSLLVFCPATPLLPLCACSSKFDPLIFGDSPPDQDETFTTTCSVFRALHR